MAHQLARELQKLYGGTRGLMNATFPHFSPKSAKEPHLRLRLTAMYIVGSAMWIVIPLAVAGLAALIRIHSGSAGAAVLSGYVLLVLMTALSVKLLSSLTNTYIARRYSDDNPRRPHRTPLEPFMVAISFIALLAVTIWFNASDACSLGVLSYTCG